jgi:hypothetical protein
VRPVTAIAAAWSAWFCLVLVALLACVAASAAQSAAPCKVVDPQLQESYTGGCRNGLANGKGKASGLATYAGGFRAGLKSGKGVKVWPWGDRYEGGFENDRKHGHGSYTWGEGSQWAGERYEGQYREDRREGWGVYTWPNGDRYEGQWKQDQRLGYSVMELRQLQAAGAQQAAFTPGTTVCWLSPAVEGGWLVKGKVESFDGSVLKIVLAEVPGGLTVAQGAPVHAGQVIADRPLDWTPCI